MRSVTHSRRSVRSNKYKATLGKELELFREDLALFLNSG